VSKLISEVVFVLSADKIKSIGIC